MFEISKPVETDSIIIGSQVTLPSQYGYFEIIPFKEKLNNLEHIAIIKNLNRNDESVLTRIHSACATGDLFGSLRCDCGDQLKKALQLIELEEKGILIYLQQEGRGIGLMNKIEAYKLQDQGMDTVDANLHLGFKADERNYKIGAEILNYFRIKSIRLLTNNPAKSTGLKSYGIEITKCIPITIKANKYNKFYLKTKKVRMGHFFE